MAEYKNKYPTFCGRVLRISGILEDEEGEIFSIVDYVPIKSEITDEEERKIFASVLLGKSEEVRGDLADKIKRVVVPFRLDPYILEESEVRARCAQMPVGPGGKMAPTYEVEVIKGRSQARDNSQLSLFEREVGARYTGFKYVKILDKIAGEEGE